MTTVRDGVEQAVLISIGAAAMTRERAEAAVGELVRRGQIGSEEGKKVVDRLMANVRGGEGGGPASLIHRFEDGVQGMLREFGVVTRAEHEDLTARLAELEHRVGLLERAARTEASAGEGPGGPAGAPEASGEGSSGP
jgi:polyhydroxyalkanoate synthesis regulator phasin